MKKIIIFNAGSSLYGAERGLLHLLKVLTHGFEITVVLPRDGIVVSKIKNISPDIRVKIFPLPVLRRSLSPLYYIAFFFLSLLHISYFSFYLARNDYDLVITNSLILPLCGITAKCAGKKHICFVREFSPGGYVNRILSLWTRRFCDRIICQSETIRERLFFNEKAEVIYEPLDDREHAVYDPARVREELGLPLEAKIIAVISRIHPTKGQYRFIEEARDYLKDNDDVLVVLAGDISPVTLRNRLYKRKIERLIRLQGLRNVRLLGFRQDIDKVLSLSDVCVFPFEREEPFGIAAAEALSFGKLSFFPKRAGLKEVYELFGMGSDYAVADIFKALTSFSTMPSPGPDRLYIPDRLSFKAYAAGLSATIDSLA